MKRYIGLWLVVVLLAIVLAGACAKPAPTSSPVPKAAPAQEWPKSIIVTTALAGSPLMVYATGIAAIIEKHMGIAASPQATTGTSEGTMLLLQKRSHLCTTDAPNAGYALKNEPPRPPDSSKIMRGITCGGYETNNNWTTLRTSGITKFEHLKGKKVMCLRQGDPIFDVVVPVIVSAYGMTLKDFSAMPEEGLTGIAQALKEGKADIGMHYGAAPVPTMVELNQTHPIRPIGHTEEGLKATMKNIPWTVERHVVPAGTYKGWDSDVLTFKYNYSVMGRSDLPDDMVYKIAKTLDENIEELKVLHPSFKAFTIQKLANSPVAPYHAGALKYYTEKGYLTEDSIKKHQEFLKIIGEQR